MSLKNFVPSIMITVAAALPVLAQEGTGEGGQPGPFGGSFLFIMLSMILIIYFIMIRPEQKRQKERTKMLSALKKGDKILTIGGIYAVIQNVKDATYIIKSGEGAVLEISKSAVQNIINDPSAVKDIVKEPDEQVKEKA